MEDEEGLGNVRYLAKRKTNYATRDVRKFVFKDNVLVPDEDMDEGGDGVFYAIRMRRAENVILSAVGIFQDKQILVTESHSAPSYLPKVIVQYGLAEGLTPAELSKAMRNMIMDGRIIKRQVGAYANRSPKIGLALSP